jgi:hypothetical protein
MIKGVHLDHSYVPVAMMDSIRVVLALGAAQGKQVFILDIKNAFQNTIEFDPTKRTYNTMPPSFAEYLRLRWNTHPELPAIEDAPSSFVVQNFCSVQGQKDAGQKFYQLMYKYICNIGLVRSILDHGVFILKQDESEMFLVLAMDECLVVCDTCQQILDLNSKMEALIEVTLQEGSILRFLNVRIIQSPAGISIDQTDHIV